MKLNGNKFKFIKLFYLVPLQFEVIDYGDDFKITNP